MINHRFIFVSLFVYCATVATAAYGQIIKPETYYWSTKPEEIKPDPKFAEASAVVLKDIRFYNFFYEEEGKGELQCVTITHRVVQINDTRAVEGYNKIYIPTSGAIDIMDIRARTISSGGKITELNKDNIKELDNKDGDGSYKLFALEGLEVGGRVEYYYKLKKEVDNSFRLNIGSTVPVQLHQLHIICPENLTYDHKTYNGTSEVTDTVIDERRFLVLTSKNVEGKDEETYSAYNSELMRHEIQLAYNSFQGKSRVVTFNSAAQRIYPFLYQFDSKDLKKIQKLSEKEGFTKLQPEDKIRHIENYIKTTIRYVLYPGEQYTLVSRILEDKIANVSGLLRLYLNFFNANGINCQVVYTTNRAQVPFDPDFETWNYLDETALYFPDFDQYLDPTDITLRYPMIPTGYHLNNALFLEELVVGNFKSATATVKKIPAPDVSKNAEVMDLSCKFNKALDSVYITQSRQFMGILAPNYRFAYNYSEPEDKKKILDELMRFSMKDGKIISSELKNYGFLESEKPLEMSGVIGGTSLIEKTGRDVLFKIGDVIGPQAQLYQEKERQLGIDMFYAHHYQRTIRVQVPDGFKATGLEALKINIKFDYEGKDACGFISDYQLEGNTLTVTANEYYNIIQFPKEQFEPFRKVINAAADFNKVSIVLEKL